MADETRTTQYLYEFVTAGIDETEAKFQAHLQKMAQYEQQMQDMATRMGRSATPTTPSAAPIPAIDAQAYKDAQQHLKSPDGWGAEYTGNINLINGMLSSAPEGVRENILGARLADGTELANHPDTLKWLASMARTVNPQITVDLPGSGGIEDLNTEIARLHKLSGDYNGEYWKGPMAQQNQDKYAKLLAERERILSRQK